MLYYFDSSALFKHYINEIGSDTIHALINETEYLETCVLTELEIVSALERMKREHKINSPIYRHTMEHFQKDIHNGTISFLNPQKDTWAEAKRLIQQRRLRVGDAIQLASALEMEGRFEEDIQFVCADNQLLHAAQLEGLECLEPT